MLNPQDRHVYLDALKPPVGYAFDRAVGTTFSLDLTTLLSVPLGFALLDWENQAGRLLLDPVALLHSLRKYADRITVFCQAGRIAVPAKQHPLFAHLERMVIEVHAPNESGVFHPKVWLLRFVAADQPVLYRLLCMSRNLTPDRSWDTLLTLEGELSDRERAYSRNHPVGDFVGALSSLARHEVPVSVHEALARMSEEIRRVKFAAPDPFEGDITFWSLGLQGSQRLPFRERIDRLLIVSPFVSDGLLTRVVKSGSNILVSRSESLEATDPEVLRRFSEVYVLDDGALEEDTDEDAELSAGGEETAQADGDVRGLHAKLFISDGGWSSSVWTGSANATNAGFLNNVEFLVQLRGKKSKVGIDTFMGGENNAVGFRNLLKSFVVGEKKKFDPEQKANEERVEFARRVLSRAKLILSVEKSPEGASHTLVLHSSGLDTLQLGEIRGSCWPVTLNPSFSAKLETLIQGGRVVFQNLTVHALTSFIGFEITAGEGNKRAMARFVLHLPLQGVPDDRMDAVLRLILRDRAQLLRYLLFLLARDEDAAAAGASLLLGRNGTSEGSQGSFDAIPLFEEMIRALARAPEKLDAVWRLAEDLRKTPEGASLLPEGFDEVWKPIWAARLARKGLRT